MALTVSVGVTGNTTEKALLLEALNWNVAKTTVPTEQEDGTVIQIVNNPLDGMNLDDALKTMVIQIIIQTLGGYQAWQKSQGETDELPTVQ